MRSGAWTGAPGVSCWGNPTRPDPTRHTCDQIRADAANPSLPQDVSLTHSLRVAFLTDAREACVPWKMSRMPQGTLILGPLAARARLAPAAEWTVDATSAAAAGLACLDARELSP